MSQSQTEHKTQKNRQVALVTGAATGLGWAITESLAKRDWAVILVDRDETLLAEKQQKLAEQGKEHFVLALDLLDQDAITTLKEQLSQWVDHIHLLVNNAGITHRSLVEVTDVAVYRRVMDLDYRVPVELTVALADLFEKPSKQTGIVNIGSMAGWMPVVGRAGYCAAKSALAQFFETLRAEQQAGDPHILMVYPSFLATDIEKNALGFDGGQASHARTSIGNVTSAEAMAERIVDAFLAKKDRLFPDRFTAFSALIYRLLPSLFIKLMKKKFADELTVGRQAQQNRASRANTGRVNR